MREAGTGRENELEKTFCFSSFFFMVGRLAAGQVGAASIIVPAGSPSYHYLSMNFIPNIVADSTKNQTSRTATIERLLAVLQS